MHNNRGKGNFMLLIKGVIILKWKGMIMPFQKAVRCSKVA